MRLASFKVCMGLIDFFFIIDIVICFRTTIIDNDGKEVKDAKIIA